MGNSEWEEEEKEEEVVVVEEMEEVRNEMGKMSQIWEDGVVVEGENGKEEAKVGVVVIGVEGKNGVEEKKVGVMDYDVRETGYVTGGVWETGGQEACGKEESGDAVGHVGKKGGVVDGREKTECVACGVGESCDLAGGVEESRMVNAVIDAV